jgi:CHAD domain-containing protein
MQRIPPPQKWLRPALSAKSRVGDAFIANAGAAVGQIRANRAGAAAGGNPEHLHQLRVGVRRLRSTLRAFRPLLRRKESRRMEKRLRTVLRAFGDARDWDVFEQAFGRAKLPRGAREQADAARRRGGAMARSATLRFLPDEVLAWARSRPWRKTANPGETIAAFGARGLERAYGRLVRSASDVDWRDAPRRHRVRILVKRLRYGCDCFAAAWPESDTKRFAKALRGLQQILGDLNDVAVQRELLEDIALSGARKPGARLLHSLAQRERGLLPKLAPAWRAFAAVSPYWRAPAAAPAAE